MSNNQQPGPSPLVAHIVQRAMRGKEEDPDKKWEAMGKELAQALKDDPGAFGKLLAKQIRIAIAEERKRGG